MLLSFYRLLIEPSGRFRWYWLASIDHHPTDWPELKDMLLEMMQKIHLEYQTCEAMIWLYRHMSGKPFVKRGGRQYLVHKLPTRRQIEAMVKVTFNPKMNGLTVKEASFGPALSHLREDYWWMERGVRWRSPSLIPKEEQNILKDVKSLLRVQLATRYPDYSPKDHKNYGAETDLHEGHYRRRSRSSYKSLH